MQLKIFSSWFWGAIAIAVIGALGMTIYFPAHRASTPRSAQQLSLSGDIQAPQNPSGDLSIASASGSVQETVRMELPIRLMIPRIKVDAAVEYVGLTPQGAMDIPKGPENVAWLDIGPRPGEQGSAVMAGHFGWKNGLPAVFDDLHILQEGDKIYIVDETGATTTFAVREVKTYGEKQDAADVFGSIDGKAHLNLVTCQGVWNKNRQSYSKRLVVFTDSVVE